MPNNIELEVKKMLSGLTGIEVESIGLEADLVNDLQIDSLKIIEVAVAIEKNFKIKVTDDELIKLKKVGDAVNLLQEKIKSPS